MAAVTLADFRKQFPEFADAEQYPSVVAQFWLDQAYSDLNAERLGKLLDLAAELFTAHMIVLSRRSRDAAANGGLPGQSTGVLNSESVDKVSIGYDVATLSEEGAGFWGSTDYGLRFWWILRQRCLGLVSRSLPTRRFRAW